MRSLDYQPVSLDGIEKLDDGPSVAEILSVIVLKEARILKEQMLRKRNRDPMRCSALTYSFRTLETPLFGTMHVGETTHGWVARLTGQMPEAIMWSGKKPDDMAFINFSDSLLSLNEATQDHQGNTVTGGAIAYLDTDRGLIYDDRIENGIPVVDSEFAAELRVILEYGLESLIPKPKLHKILAKI